MNGMHSSGSIQISGMPLNSTDQCTPLPGYISRFTFVEVTLFFTVAMGRQGTGDTIPFK